MRLVKGLFFGMVVGVVLFGYWWGSRRELARYGAVLPEDVICAVDDWQLKKGEFETRLKGLDSQTRAYWEKDPEGFAEELVKEHLVVEEGRRRGLKGSDEEVIQQLQMQIWQKTKERGEEDVDTAVVRMWQGLLDRLYNEAERAGRVRKNALWVKRWRQRKDIVQRNVGRGIPVIVDFGRGACLPCRRMEKRIRELAGQFEGRVKFLLVNIDEEPTAVRRYHINVIPLQVFYDASGRQVLRHEGEMQEEELWQKAERLAAGELKPQQKQQEEGFVGRIRRALRGNMFFALLLVFVGGFLTAANPCVLASVPLLIGFVGGYRAGVKKAFILSLFLLLGLATMFSVMGVAAALTGRLLGNLGFENWFKHVAVVVCVLLGTHFAGLWRLSGGGVSEKLVPKKLTMLGAYLFGLLFGVISTPCALPVVALLCALIAVKGSLLFGALALFVYSVGHSVLLLAAGTSVGLAQRMLESKRLVGGLQWLRRGAGCLLVVVAFLLAADIV